MNKIKLGKRTWVNSKGKKQKAKLLERNFLNQVLIKDG